MKLSFEYTRKNLYYLGVMVLIGIAIALISPIPWWSVPVFGGLYFLMLCMKLELKKGIPWVWTAVVIILGATLCVFAIQYMLLEWEDFMKTSDLMLFTNVVMVVGVALVVLLISKRPVLSIRVAYIWALVFALADYFVYQFRGNEFAFADFRAIGIGMTVVSKYKFTINIRVAVVLMVSILFLTLVGRFKIEFKQITQFRIITALLVIIAVLLVVTNSIGVTTETWEMKGTYRNGYLLNFTLGIRDSFVTKPDGYSEEAVAAIEDRYETSRTFSGEMTSLEEGQKPTIIVIMNESFSDLSVLGELQTNSQVTPFLDSLGENTLKGYALSSVYGAKTPNSEWEYMTGNSMAFLPDGSVVYQQYIDEHPYSIVSTLKENDYTCVAMHPYYETGWSRDTVYPKLGYDEMYFIEDFDEENLLREYITDSELYEKIIDRYEAKEEGENLYIMGITMQNHGGYGERYDNFRQKIHKVGPSYTDGNQYLSLMYESDQAFAELVRYFEKVDEPVEIVFFGDHQPGLCQEFITLLNGKGTSGLSTDEVEKLYTVPFYIWTNYDTPEQTVEITSLNYLSTFTLQRANITLPSYNQFLADMYEEVPAINSRGYYSRENGHFIPIDEATGKEAEWIQDYSILEYNAMFDDKNRSKVFFTQ